MAGTASSLTDMLKQSPTTPMKMSSRAIYIKIVRKLTKPLMDAYYLMLKEVISASLTCEAQEDHLPSFDCFSSDNHFSSKALHSLHSLILSGAMHIQEPAKCSGDHRRGPSLNCTATLIPFNKYSIPNTALFLKVATSKV
jgi:hypothetical protein